ncbi:MAG: chemotaxis protein MotB [Bdellovibrio sp. CG10_big_fil_rev_8_21_14_0_10_47_8]|nr:MAG: chemotaxis protein MotB [Bdellovibrio sp. CG10_big_fil_rev_8_21_14_0_10_47_8]
MIKKRHEEHENHERWLVSYADFITLLFAFFVVLYATSTQNEEKEKKFEDSVRASFKMIGGAGERNQDLGNPLGQLFDPLDLVQKRDIGNAELEDSIERLLRKTMSDEERKETIGSISRDRQGVRITLAASRFFPSGSSKLRMPALKSLDKIARVLKLSNRDIVIEGHTDDQSLTGRTSETNWELAGLRATSVVRYLSKYHEIEPSHLSAVSYGQYRPLVRNIDESSREKNRRIEILVMNRRED